MPKYKVTAAIEVFTEHVSFEARFEDAGDAEMAGWNIEAGNGTVVNVKVEEIPE